MSPMPRYFTFLPGLRRSGLGQVDFMGRTVDSAGLHVDAISLL